MANQITDVIKQRNSEGGAKDPLSSDYDKRVAFLASRLNKNRNNFANTPLPNSSNLNPENIADQRQMYKGDEKKIFQTEERLDTGIRRFEKLSTDKKFQKRNRLDPTSVALMVSVAIFFDACQIGLNIIPIVGWFLSSIVGIFAWLTFYIWTSIKGWGLSDTVKKWFVQIGLRSMDIIPIGNALPLSTISVLLQISFLKAEDTLYNTTHGKVDVEELSKLAKKYQEYYKKPV